jgi:hypothetical protein
LCGSGFAHAAIPNTVSKGYSIGCPRFLLINNLDLFDNVNDIEQAKTNCLFTFSVAGQFRRAANRIDPKFLLAMEGICRYHSGKLRPCHGSVSGAATWSRSP